MKKKEEEEEGVLRGNLEGNGSGRPNPRFSKAG